MQHREDPTIQQLFALAKDIFGTDIHEYENFLVVLQQVCNQANSQFSKACKRLLEDVEDPESRKRTARCLDDGILYVNEMCRKHHITVEPLTTSLELLSVGSSSFPHIARTLSQLLNTKIPIGSLLIRSEVILRIK